MIDFTSAIDTTSGYAGYGAPESDDPFASQSSAWPLSDEETQPVALQRPAPKCCFGDQDDSEIAALEKQLGVQQNEIDQLQREYQSLGGGCTAPKPPPCEGPPRGRTMQPFDVSAQRPEL
jgi:hypothetical protein